MYGGMAGAGLRSGRLRRYGSGTTSVPPVRATRGTAAGTGRAAACRQRAALTACPWPAVARGAQPRCTPFHFPLPEVEGALPMKAPLQAVALIVLTADRKSTRLNSRH